MVLLVVLLLAIILVIISATFTVIELSKLDTKTITYIVAMWLSMVIIAVMCIVIPEVINDRRVSRQILSNTDG